MKSCYSERPEMIQKLDNNSYAFNYNIEEVKNINLPAGINNPIAYLIRGTGFSKPYRNGYAIVCEFAGIPIPGEEVLIFCKDGSIYAGEFQREEDILISIDSYSAPVIVPASI